MRACNGIPENRQKRRNKEKKRILAEGEDRDMDSSKKEQSVRDVVNCAKGTRERRTRAVGGAECGLEYREPGEQGE